MTTDAQPDAAPGFSICSADPEPVERVCARGGAPLVLTCEHGGRAVPASLAGGVPAPKDMDRHIAWDIGAAEVARGVAKKLDSALVIQRYSRLVIDCNRPRHASDLTPEISDGTRIPFNVNLGETEIDARWRSIHQPFHQAVARLLDARGKVALVAVHSFTRKLRNGAPRPMEVGLSARKDLELAHTLGRELLREDPELHVAFDAPYRIRSDSDYTIPVHAEARRLPHVLLEVRNDLIADAAGVSRWIVMLSTALTRALRSTAGKTNDNEL